MSSGSKDGFCIYIDTVFQGAVPVVSENGRYCVFEKEVDAQREIADYMMTRLQQFLDGERDFADAIAVEEYVVSVTVTELGEIIDEDGNCFGPEVK